MNLAIIIASFNEGQRLTQSLKALVDQLDGGLLDGLEISFVHIIVVDDGSREYCSLPSLSSSKKVQINLHQLIHWVNLGQGAALQTGLEFARDVLGSDLFVTMDADGQHRPEDLPLLLQPLTRQDSLSVDFVFGNRFGSQTVEVPKFRKILLRMATRFEGFITGLQLHDAHNGYRAFSRKAAQVIHLKQNRMAHATEFKQIVHRKSLRYAEVPVHIRYSQETLSKGQSNLGSFRILRDLLQLYLFDQS